MFEYFQYHAFGLNISSEIELPELSVRKFEQEDVQIKLGQNPDNLNRKTAEGVLYQANKDQFLLTIQGISSYYVKRGKHIIIDIDKNSSLSDVRLFLLGPVVGALLLQRKMLPLHGSSVVKNNVATVLCGRSGAGKSTLAALLINRGFSLLADDISLVNNNDGIPKIIPGITQIKLWQDVIEHLYDDYSSFPRIREQLLRYWVSADKFAGSSDNRIRQIIVLEKKNSPGFEWEEATGMQKFGLVKDHTYREQYIAGLGTNTDHFNQISSLLANIKVYVLRRPNTPLLLNELADFVEMKLIDL